MTMNEYQDAAHVTAQYPQYNIHDVVSYVGLGIAGEAGEIANKLKKSLRGDYVLDEQANQIADEIGDCLWYLSELALQLGFELDNIAQANIKKLAWRQTNGTIKGSGDHR